jgi:prepilin peptidase CpaA
MDAVASYFPLVFALMLSALLAAVIYRDGRDYLIPNTLSIAVAALFFPAALLLGLPLLPALLAGGIAFAITFGLFALKLFGGGDAKLLPALMLWTGWNLTSLQFLFLMAILGGVLAIVLLALRFLLRRRAGLPQLLQPGAPIPYGIAIASAFLWLLWQGQIFPFSL